MCWRPQDVGGSIALYAFQEEVCTGSGTSPGNRNILLSSKLEGQSHLSPLTSDMEVQDLEFALLDFSLALVQYFLTVPLIPPFWDECIFCAIVC